VSTRLTLVEPSTNLPRDYGEEWNDADGALLAQKGPSYSGQLVRLYIDVQPDDASPGSGNEIGGWHDFAPGFLQYLDQYKFDGVASAVGVVQTSLTAAPQEIQIQNSSGTRSTFSADRFVGTMVRDGTPVAIANELAEAVQRTALVSGATVQTSQLRRVAGLARKTPFDPAVVSIFKLNPPRR
jgi:hypothetical protein